MSSDIYRIEKAFTLNSSWLVSAILHGRKPLENRSQVWPPGWYALHLGVSSKGDAWAEKHVRECCETDASVCIVAEDVRDKLFPKGAIVGFCQLAHALPPDACRGSPWALGPFCMIISKTMFLRTPIKNVRGQLGLWSLDAPTRCLLAHHVGSAPIRVSNHVQEFPPDPRALARARARLIDEKRAHKRKRDAPADAATQTTLKFSRSSSASGSLES